VAHQAIAKLLAKATPARKIPSIAGRLILLLTAKYFTEALPACNRMSTLEWHTMIAGLEIINTYI
jgi:hypothetical protein